MKTSEELRKLEVDKLATELEETQSQLYKIRFDVKNGQSKNSHMIRKYRKYTAMINTIRKEKELNPVTTK